MTEDSRQLQAGFGGKLRNGVVVFFFQPCVLQMLSGDICQPSFVLVTFRLPCSGHSSARVLSLVTEHSSAVACSICSKPWCVLLAP